jgi:hypothetical protein
MSNIVKDHFIYRAAVDTLAAGSIKTSIIQIEADSSFVAVKCSYFADIAGAPQTEDTRVIPLVRVQIQDSGSGRNLQNFSIPIDTIAGRGELPFVLPIPREFKASSNIKFTFENYSAATTYANVEFILAGYKTFNLG